jgi:hypothetical protein
MINAGSWFARIAAFAVICCSVVAPVLAQQPSAGALAVAKELVELKSGAGMFDTVISGTVDRLKGLVLQTNPQLVKDINATADVLKAEFAPRRSELVAEVAKLYAARFTEQELKELLAFYKTALGKKLIAQEPQVLDETVRFSQVWAARTSDEILRRFRAEMKKRGHDL